MTHINISTMLCQRDNSLPKLSLLQTIHISKDPAVYEVFAEGGASIIGLIFAAAGIVAAAWLHVRWADGLASIAIGFLLGLVAFDLGSETRSLLFSLRIRTSRIQCEH